MTTRTALAGLFNRKERWGLSLRGWIALSITVLVAGLAAFLGVQPFLALNKPVSTEYLVIEGWIPDYAVAEAAKIFKDRGYKKIFTVGGPVGGEGSRSAADDTFAYVAIVRLKKLGMDRALYEMIPNQVRTRDRTFGSAYALQKSLAEQKIAPQSLDVVTLGVHARRTRLLFQKAFADRAQIGVISIPPVEYNEKKWWRFSEGLKDVVSESGAYLYARLFFRPETGASTTP